MHFLAMVCGPAGFVRAACVVSMLLILGGCYDLVPAQTQFASSSDAAGDAGVDSQQADAFVDAVVGDGLAGETHGSADASGGTDGAGGDLDAVADTTADGVESDAVEADATNGADTVTPDSGAAADAAPADPCTGKAEKSPCDDGDPCTTSFCKGGKCSADADLCECKVSADCAAKEDGDLCTGTLYCNTVVVPHKCQTNPATPVTCKKSTSVCTVVQCDGKAGACKTTAVKDTLPPKSCNDDNPCTKADACAKGVCMPGVNTCLCTKHADCAKQEDGDVCNGTLFCDTSLPKPQCVLNPATVVSCPSGDNSCVVNKCDTKTGKCVSSKSADAAPCEDGNPCTKSDTCTSGVCQPGVDTCQCKTTADCAQFDDGDLCNGSDYCDVKTGTCKTNPKTVVQCKSGDECAPISCVKATGKCASKPVQKFSACNADGNPCTVDDTCDGKGGCVAGTDVCVCDKNSDCDKHEDGNACNGKLYCDKLAQPPTCKVNPATVVQCKPPVGPCELATCDVKTGQCSAVKKANFSACEDGNKCTLGDVCEQGKCTSGPDLCACKADGDCLDDGDICNGTPYCDKTPTPATCKLKANTVITCDPKLTKGCVVAVCAAKTGICAGAPSDDGCDDKDPCTVDVCGKTGTCTHNGIADGAACVDAKTSKAGTCIGGACQSAPVGMVFVPAGVLPMGCNKTLDPGCDADEKPQHEVTLKAFWIDRFEATAAAYKACIDAGNCKAPSAIAKTCNHGVKARLFHPINCIDHAAAAAFCAHGGKRLPTEAEWELAARGGCNAWPNECAASQPRFPWALAVATCAFTVMKSDPGPGCGVGTTRGVGTYTKDSSPLGVRDMGGNVAEWTNDWYAKDYYANSPAVDPPGPVTATQRTVRGGHFQSLAAGVRAGNRHAVSPVDALPSIGVRCVKHATSKP